MDHDAGGHLRGRGCQGSMPAGAEVSSDTWPAALSSFLTHHALYDSTRSSTRACSCRCPFLRNESGQRDLGSLADHSRESAFHKNRLLSLAAKATLQHCFNFLN